VADVELTYNTNENNKAIAEFVQAQWKQNLGLTIPIKNMEWRTFLDVKAKFQYKGMARMGWIGDYMDPHTFLSLFSTPAGDSGTGWYDPKFAAMLIAANREADPQKRYELLAAAERVVLDVQPIIPLYTAATNWVKKPYVKGMFGNPATMHAWKFVYIEHDPSKWDDEEPDPVAR
jgi:oligopeptide transport system substrate-binding protein